MRTMEIQKPDGTPISVTGRLSPDGRTLTYITGATPVVGEAAVGFTPTIGSIPVVSRNGLTYVDADRLPPVDRRNVVTYLTDATMTSYVAGAALSSPGGSMWSAAPAGAATAWAVAVLPRVRVMPRPARNLSAARRSGTAAAIPRSTYRA